MCAGEEKGWSVYLLRPRAQCAAGCSMWRAGAVSWPRSARVTHRTYTPSIPPMHQEVTHPHPTTGNMQNIECSLWTRDAFTKENIVTSEYCEYQNTCKNRETLTAAVWCSRVAGARQCPRFSHLTSLLATVNKLHSDDQQLCPLSPAQPGAVLHLTRFAT